MRLLGLSALASAALSFFLFIVAWVGYTFFLPTTTYSGDSDGYREGLLKVLQGVSLLTSVLEYVAILLIAAGLIVGSKYIRKTES